MTKTILASLSAACLAVACGGSGTKTTTGPGGGGDARPALQQALDVLPEDTGVVVGVKPAALAASPLVQRAWDKLAAGDEAAELAEIKATCGMDFSYLESLVMGVPLSGNGVVAHATGKLDESKVNACIEAMATKKGGKLVREDHAGVGHFHIEGAEGENAHWAFLRPGAAVFADSATSLAGAFDKTAKKARDNAALAAGAGGVNQDKHLFFVAPLPAEVGQELVDQTGGQLEAAPTLVRGWAEAGDQAVTLEVTGVWATSAGAASAEAMAKQAMELARSMGDPQAMGTLLDGVTVRLDGSELTVKVVLDQADFDVLENL